MHSFALVFLGAAPALVELEKTLLVDDIVVTSLEFGTEAPHFTLILAYDRRATLRWDI